MGTPRRIRIIFIIIRRSWADNVGSDVRGLGLAGGSQARELSMSE